MNKDDVRLATRVAIDNVTRDVTRDVTRGAI
jgi:hypothetical protein